MERQNCMTQKQKTEQMSEIVRRLKEIYPSALCALEWGGQNGTLDEDTALRESWKLLVMARLSAQCTDARVNIVCRDLFARYPTVEAMANADISELESVIRPCGLFRTKADSIKRACEILVRDFGGIVPSDMNELLSLPGVGRKIANLVRGDIYRLPGVVADTHCIRICGRFGMYPESLKDPTKVERLLSPLIEPCEQSDFCHRIVQFGRDVCTARAPSCGTCPLSDVCRHAKQST